MCGILQVLKICVHGLPVNICHFSQLEQSTKLSSVVSIRAGKEKRKENATESPLENLVSPCQSQSADYI